jgi:hypothetical protein
MNRAIVIAHFHAGGLVQSNLRLLVQALLALPARIIFVSTRATPEALGTLPAGVQAIARPNVGYDFESYRTGIAALGDLAGLDQLVLMNSSFVCIDAEKLCDRFFRRAWPGADVVALTASREITPHLQSYLIAFSNRALVSDAFGAWWRSVEPVNDRDAVIGRYEIGMSVHFAHHGFHLGAAFQPTPAQKLLELCRYLGAGGEMPPIMPDGNVTLNVNAADRLNATHYLWDALLEEFGIMKVELLKRNPYSMDLRQVSRRLLHDSSFRELVHDVLDEPAPAHEEAAAR